MTSRDDLWLMHSEDRVDVLIRCALRERIAKAMPSPGIWQRICDTVVRSSGLRQALGRVELYVEASGLHVLGGDSLVPARQTVVTDWGSTALARHELHWTRLNRHQVMRLVA